VRLIVLGNEPRHAIGLRPLDTEQILEICGCHDPGGGVEFAISIVSLFIPQWLDFGDLLLTVVLFKPTP
jgi:hypothetical protein